MIKTNARLGRREMDSLNRCRTQLAAQVVRYQGSPTATRTSPSTSVSAEMPRWSAQTCPPRE